MYLRLQIYITNINEYYILTDSNVSKLVSSITNILWVVIYPGSAETTSGHWEPLIDNW